MRPGDRLSKWIPWAVVVPWALWALVRIVGLDSTAALVAIIGLTPVAAATALIPIVVALAVGVRSAAVVAGIVAAVLITLVLPRMFGGPTEAVGSGGPTVRVLSANMMLGEGSPESLMDLVEEVEPDVLSVEELTPDLARQLDRLGLKEQLPHRNLAEEPGSQGSGLYSRVPMNGRQVSELPGGFPLVTGVIAMPGAAPIEVTSVHTVPPTVDGWTEDLDALPSAPEGGEAVLLGDFNATLDHAPFRALLDRGYEDAAGTLGEGLVPTWPQDRRYIPPLFAIDHVLAGETIGMQAFSAHEVEGTDHRAISAELQLPAG